MSKYLPCHLIILYGSNCFIPLFYRYTYINAKFQSNGKYLPSARNNGGLATTSLWKYEPSKRKNNKVKIYKDETFFFFRVLGLVFSSSSSSPFSLGQMGVEKKEDRMTHPVQQKGLAAAVCVRGRTSFGSWLQQQQLMKWQMTLNKEFPVQSLSLSPFLFCIQPRDLSLSSRLLCAWSIK